jgi:hypothetical protein
LRSRIIGRKEKAEKQNAESNWQLAIDSWQMTEPGAQSAEPKAQLAVESSQMKIYTEDSVVGRLMAHILKL